VTSLFRYRQSTPRRRRSVYGRTKQEATRRLAAAIGNRDEGLPSLDGRLRLGAYLARWLDEVVQPAVRARTMESYAMIVERHLAPALGGVGVVALEPSDVARYLRQKRDQGLSERTVQYHHAVLRRALRDAERWGLVHRNVAPAGQPAPGHPPGAGALDGGGGQGVPGDGARPPP
jgi:hypothetical protein